MYYRRDWVYHSTTFYSQLLMMKHNSANFSRQKDNMTDLPNPMSALSMFLMPPDGIRMTHARIVQGQDDLSARYDMPLDEAKRIHHVWLQAVEEFRKNWGIFTEGSLILTPRIIGQ